MKKIGFLFAFALLAVSVEAQVVSSGSNPGAMHVVCDQGCSGGVGGGGTSAVDNSAFNLGVDAFTPGGGTFNNTLSALSTGVSAAFRITQHRALWINLRDNAGAEIGVSANPIFATVSQSTGTNLHIVCDSGCGSPPASADGTAFTFGTTNVSAIAAVVDDVATNSVSENSYGAPRMSATRLLYTDLSKSLANTNAFLVTGPLTDTQLRASVVPVTAVLTAGAASIGSISNTSFTANAGTNLNTSLLALEAGGNLAAIKARTDNIPPLGQALAAASTPVVLTAAQLITLTPVSTVTANAGTNLNTSALALDATLTGRLPAGASPANAETNTNTNLSRIGSFNFVYNGSTWDRWTGAVTVASLPLAETSPVATASNTNATNTCYLTSAATTNSTNCKASAGNVYFVHVTNTTTTNYYLRMYNLAAAPTCSSATGFVETIPALGAAANGGINGRVNVIPQAYSAGIGFCLTGGGTSTDNTSAAVGVYITIGHK